MTCGIYLIQHAASGRKYVGSSVNIPKRWKEHVYELKKNAHKNRKLQNVFNKYGPESLQYTVLEVCEADKLLEREGFWINNTPPELLLNINLDPSKVHFTPEIKASMSATQTQRLSDPTLVEAASKGMAACWQDPERRDQMLNKLKVARETLAKSNVSRAPKDRTKHLAQLAEARKKANRVTR